MGSIKGIEIAPGVVVTDAHYEELNAEYYVAFVTVQTDVFGWIKEIETMFMLPQGYDPELDGGRRGAELLRAYYNEEAS